MKILHHKFDMEEVSPEVAVIIHNLISDQVGEEVIVVSSPAEIESLTDTIVIDEVEISVEDIKKIKSMKV